MPREQTSASAMLVRKRSQGITIAIAFKGVLLTFRVLQSGRRRACVKANLLVDGVTVLEAAGMPSLGLAKHRADEPVEQIDGLVC
jgi:hypothetical protein